MSMVKKMHQSKIRIISRGQELSNDTFHEEGPEFASQSMNEEDILRCVSRMAKQDILQYITMYAVKERNSMSRKL